MRKIAYSFFLLVIFFSQVHAASAEATGSRIVREFSISTGSRLDNFDWNIAGNSAGTNPNILSELTWRDLEIWEIKALLRAYDGGFYIRGYLDFGGIYDGTNQDSDYSGDNRTNEFSRSNNSSKEGSVWDASIGIGEVIKFSPRLKLMPLMGLSYHKQNLTMTDGYQTIPPTGPFPGLDSTYAARWAGPWAGLDLLYGSERFSLEGALELHYAWYLAEADWNLRTDLAHSVSFEHTAEGVGVVFSLGGYYNVSPGWSAGLLATARVWNAADGVDKTFFANGAIAETRLNEVNWNSSSLLLSLKREF